MWRTSPERTGWRHEELSRRHRRLWGFDCPAVDVDWLVVEYDSYQPAALVEYKLKGGEIPDVDDPNRRALTALADRADVPLLLVEYRLDFSAWRVTPWNDAACGAVPLRCVLDEVGYVRLLYRLRGRALPTEVEQRLLRFEDGAHVV